MRMNQLKSVAAVMVLTALSTPSLSATVSTRTYEADINGSALLIDGTFTTDGTVGYGLTGSELDDILIDFEFTFRGGGQSLTLTEENSSFGAGSDLHTYDVTEDMLRILGSSIAGYFVVSDTSEPQNNSRSLKSDVIGAGFFKGAYIGNGVYGARLYASNGNGYLPSQTVASGSLLGATVATTPVPVPASLPLLAAGLGATALMKLRQSRRSA